MKLETADQHISYKIDTGADVNVLPKHLYYSLSPRPKLKQSPIKLQALMDPKYQYQFMESVQFQFSTKS